MKGIESMEESKLDVLIALQKKQLLAGRIHLIAAAVLAVLVIVGGVLGFGVFGREMADLKQQNEELRIAVEENGDFDVTPLVTAIMDVTNQVDLQELNKTVAALKEAAATLSKVDTEHLNTLINDLDQASRGLNDVIGVLRKLFGK